MAARSQNGYSANVPLLVKRYNVPGTGVGLTLRRGATATVLLYVASQFDKRVEDIDNARGGLDDWGYAERPVRGSLTVLSNHASGTAQDLNATRHPLGKRGTFTTAQVTEIHRILAECSGVVRWGGDYAGRPDEMHFEINASTARVVAAAAKLTARRIAKPREDNDDMKLTDKIGRSGLTVGVVFERVATGVQQINRMRGDLATVKAELAEIKTLLTKETR